MVAKSLILMIQSLFPLQLSYVSLPMSIPFVSSPLSPIMNKQGMRSNNYTSYIFNPMYILLKTLPCHPAERLWAQEPSFQCGREKTRICTFFGLGAYAFCALLSARSLLASRSRARKRKRAGANLCQTFIFTRLKLRNPLWATDKLSSVGTGREP